MKKIFLLIVLLNNMVFGDNVVNYPLIRHFCLIGEKPSLSIEINGEKGFFRIDQERIKVSKSEVEKIIDSFYKIKNLEEALVGNEKSLNSDDDHLFMVRDELLKGKNYSETYRFSRSNPNEGFKSFFEQFLSLLDSK